MSTGLQFSIAVEGQDSECFEMTEFNGHESLSELYAYKVTLFSSRDNLTPNDNRRKS